MFFVLRLRYPSVSVPVSVLMLSSFVFVFVYRLIVSLPSIHVSYLWDLLSRSLYARRLFEVVLFFILLQYACYALWYISSSFYMQSYLTPCFPSQLCFRPCAYHLDASPFESRRISRPTQRLFLLSALAETDPGWSTFLSAQNALAVLL